MWSCGWLSIYTILILVWCLIINTHYLSSVTTIDPALLRDTVWEMWSCGWLSIYTILILSQLCTQDYYVTRYEKSDLVLDNKSSFPKRNKRQSTNKYGFPISMPNTKLFFQNNLQTTLVDCRKLPTRSYIWNPFF